MADRPIIFSAPMVRALLAGQKTQTRRLLKPQPSKDERGNWWINDARSGECRLDDVVNGRAGCMKYMRGDRLYAREAWKPHSTYTGWKPRDIPPSAVFYRADDRYAPSNTPWVPSIHMPRWASRLTLIVEDVRVERLQEISEGDVLAEGAPLCPDHRDTTQDGSNPHMCVINEGEPWATQSPRAWYRRLWSALHTKPGERWEDNPWIVALTFRVEHGNIDSLPSPAASIARIGGVL